MSTTPDHTVVRWVKSSYSGNGGGSCLEWAPDGASTSDLVPVRDSKDPAVGTITVTPGSWSSFVSFIQVQDI
ncbi:protein of unknown function DUF397 [Actinobacteria bacterium OK074]|nr:protein of unknown function DUF397 [Actinobacteria bacterium OK074]